MLYVVSDDDDSHSQVCSYDLDGGGTEVLFKRDGYVSDVCMIGNRVFYMYSTADGKSEIRSAGVFDTSDGKDLTTEFDGDLRIGSGTHVKRAFDTLSGLRTRQLRTALRRGLLESEI